ncbi:MAG TPA: universal stress protein [Coleofasciculaceae cyanobacterium]
MFNKILVAMDNSELSDQTLEEAIDLAKVMDARLMLLHVLSHDEEGSPDNAFPLTLESSPTITNEILELRQEQWQAFSDQSLALLRSRTDKAIAAGVQAEFSQVFGNPGRCICEFAETWGADVIVSGRRGHSGWTEFLIGSVSNYILHHAPCSVLTIQGEGAEVMTHSLQNSQDTLTSESAYSELA